AGGPMGDRRPVAVAERTLQLQALSSDHQGVGGLPATKQKVGQGIADLREPGLEVAFVVDLMSPKIETVGCGELAAVGAEQPVVMEPLGAGRTRHGGLPDHRTLVEELLSQLPIVPISGQ